MMNFEPFFCFSPWKILFWYYVQINFVEVQKKKKKNTGITKYLRISFNGRWINQINK
jgi:hypothetical protein